MIADRDLYLTAEKDRVVEEGDPAARFVLCGKGGPIPAEYQNLPGIPKDEDEPKADPPAADGKALTAAPQNKAVTGKETKATK